MEIARMRISTLKNLEQIVSHSEHWIRFSLVVKFQNEILNIKEFTNSDVFRIQTNDII